jgi:hypothetical protein
MGHDQAFRTITWHPIIETVPLFSTGQPSGLSPENQHQYLNTISTKLLAQWFLNNRLLLQLFFGRYQHFVYSVTCLLYVLCTTQQIPHCRNSSKISSKTRRNRGKIDTPKHIYCKLTWYKYFNENDAAMHPCSTLHTFPVTIKSRWTRCPININYITHSVLNY